MSPSALVPILDRKYELDLRSLDYPVTAKIEETEGPVYRPRSYTWSIDQWLDQGSEGACVGFAFAHDLSARPQSITGISDAYARWVYKEAQKVDPWEGEAYSGTSVLAGAKILKREGFYRGYWWALTAEDIAKAVAYWGPGILGVNWYSGMFRTDAQGFITPTGTIAGGHAIAVVALKIHYKPGSWTHWWSRSWRDVDFDRSYFVLHNSWGRSWGESGTAKITFSHVDRLMAENGDACFPERNYDDELSMVA